MKRKILAATSLILALSMPLSASIYEDSREDNNITDVPQPIDEMMLEYDMKSIANKISKLSMIEDYIDMPTNNPSAIEETQKTVEVETLKSESTIENYVDNIEFQTRSRLIEKMSIDPILKDVLKSMVVGNFPNSSSAEAFVRILNANSKDMPELLIDFFSYMSNTVRSTISNSGQTILYPQSTIQIFDNTTGVIPLAKCMYMLKDPSTYGNYRIYRQSVSPHGGNIGTDIIITDDQGHILVCLHTERTESSYCVVKNRDLYVTPLEDYLNSIDLASEQRDEYCLEDLSALQFAISAKVGDFDTEPKDSYDPDNVLVLEVPATTGSWFISNAGNEQRYYFLEKRGQYLFGEKTYVCSSIFHDDAYVTFDTTGTYGLVYKDYTEKIFIKCDNTVREFESIVPLSQFIEEKAAEFFDGDDNSELAFLYGELTRSTRSKEDKVMQMKPIDTW